MPKDKKPRAGNNLLEEPMKKAPFTKVRGGAPSDGGSAHPLHKNLSRVSEVMDRIAGKDAAEEKFIEDVEDWKKCVQSLAGSPNGTQFLKIMVRHMGLYAAPNTQNTVKMVEDAGKRAFYLTFVRPYLTATHKGEIE